MPLALTSRHRVLPGFGRNGPPATLLKCARAETASVNALECARAKKKTGVGGLSKFRFSRFVQLSDDARRDCVRIRPMRRRFFVERFDGNRALIEGEAAHHLGRVLRAERSQVYELSDGSHVWLARVEEVKRDRIGFSLVEEVAVEQPTLQTTLLLSVVKFDAFELALEKATELGVGTVVPLAAARSEKALLAAAQKRAERWKKILLEASQQSRRLRIPELAGLTKPESAFSTRAESRKILLSERPDAPSLRSILEAHRAAGGTTVTTDAGRPGLREGVEEVQQAIGDPEVHGPAGGSASATLAIGPEGGWTDAEFACARKHGFCEASLGRLILRTETAVIASLASLNYALSGQEL